MFTGQINVVSVVSAEAAASVALLVVASLVCLSVLPRAL